MTPLFLLMLSVLFCEQEIWVDDLKADVVLDIAHNDALALLLFTNYRLALGILHQLRNGLRQSLALLHDRNRLDSKRSEGFFDFCRRAFVVGVNQVEGKKVVLADVVLVPLNAVAANLTL